jgi:hypothetical protein
VVTDKQGSAAFHQEIPWQGDRGAALAGLAAKIPLKGAKTGTFSGFSPQTAGLTANARNRSQIS